MKPIVLGTAGHIDHGKTTLTKALTGVDTDQMKEEKERKISIEPGFAPFTLPSGRKASIIDVPGHERLIRQMVAGISGIDFVLLTVAADEGIMPQTREHIEIIRLLDISGGLIVITKQDLADPELAPLIEEEALAAVQGTVLEHAPIIWVSAVKKTGIETLIQKIDALVTKLPQPSMEGPFRLPIDRAFTLRGAGTIVTGTVISGRAQPGDELVVLPGEYPVRVRNVQVHGDQAPLVRTGQRAAFNLVGVEREQLYRGQTLASPDYWRTTQRIDAKVSALRDLSFSLRQGTSVKIMIGTTETTAEIILYDRKEWQANEEAFVSLRLKAPIIAARGDRFVLRRPSPPATVGGGVVVNPYAKKLKVHPSSALQIKTRFATGVPELILLILEEGNLLQAKTTIAQSLTLMPRTIEVALQELLAANKIHLFANHYASAKRLKKQVAKMRTWLHDYHQQYPMRVGAPKPELMARFLPGIANKEAAALFAHFDGEEGILHDGENVALSHFTPHVPSPWDQRVDRLLKRLKQEALAPSPWDSFLSEANIPEEIGEELLLFLNRKGKIALLNKNLVIHGSVYDEAIQLITNTLKQTGSLTMQQIKQVFPLSRKYLIPLLERMDNDGITLRQGELRYLQDHKK